MASEAGDSEGQAQESHGPRECMPCRGTGRVISNLGGTETSVTCPWCGGGGVRLTDIDAQARWLDVQAADAEQGSDSSPPSDG